MEAATARLCAEEKERAYELYGPIRNNMEGYGVLAEEVQEFVENATFFIQPYEFSMDALLRTVRNGDSDDVVRKLERMKKIALQAACEAIQVAAVCDRFAAIYDKGEEDQDGDALESKPR